MRNGNGVAVEGRTCELCRHWYVGNDCEVGICERQLQDWAWQWRSEHPNALWPTACKAAAEWAVLHHCDHWASDGCGKWEEAVE